MQPTTAEELAEFIRGHSAHGLTVQSRCGGVEDSVCVDLSRFDQIVAYPAADMTITVQSGVTVAAIESALGEHNQHLPIDVFDSQTAIGDAVAWDLSGSRRFGFGTFRDCVIGVSAVDGQGRCFKSGGQVVKNVAGYDLCKLLIGSHGTLGIVTQLTFKVLPKPAARGGVRFRFADAADVERNLESLTTSETRPVAVDVLGADACSLAIVFDGTAREVAWQQEQVQAEMTASESVLMSEDSVRDHLVTASELHEPAPRRFVAGMRPSVLMRFLQQANCPVQVAHAANGIVVGESDSLHAVRSMAEGLGGWCRSNTGQENPFVGAATLEIMQKVKRAFDPNGILNPHIVIGNA